MMKHEDPNWWRGSVIYQVYPRSFKDTTGNGTGDLPGILEKIDYIESLGVDAIWLSPFFESPMKDFGYDISDYRQVDSLFGTNDDFAALLKAAHERNIGVIIDMVANHTSDQHPWFRESRRDRENPKADWYLWADPKPDGTAPNNWMSVFGGGAWTFEPRRGQYYYHGFLKNQPDLNLWNKTVQDAVLDEMEYWLQQGVNGLRLDVCNHYIQDRQLRDNPVKDNPRKRGSYPLPYNMQQHVYDRTRPENIQLLERIRKLLNRYPGTFAIGEVGDDETVKTVSDYTAGNDRLHTVYCFTLLHADRYEPAAFRKPIAEFFSFESGGWPSWPLSNHDAMRAATRLGGDHADNPAFIRQLLAMQLMLRGTQLIYQGQELGLTEAEIPYEKMQDPWGKKMFPMARGRDGSRTPMPWKEEPVRAGFTTAEEPWLPIPDEHLGLSVEVQDSQPDSPLNFLRRFLQWRKGCMCVLEGEIVFFDCMAPFLVFLRQSEHQKIWAAYNLSAEQETLSGDVLPVDACDPVVPEIQQPEFKEDEIVFPPFGVCLSKM